jgi:hypothetical protein
MRLFRPGGNPLEQHPEKIPLVNGFGEIIVHIGCPTLFILAFQCMGRQGNNR